MSPTFSIARAVLAAALLAPGAVAAQPADTASAPAHGAHGAAPVDAGTAAAHAYEDANARMHRDMAIALSGDPDRDFAEMMIAHHQGAIDMARVVMEHGRDPAIRALAEEVVATQEREVAFLRDWLARVPGAAAAAAGHGEEAPGDQGGETHAQGD